VAKECLRALTLVVKYPLPVALSRHFNLQKG
jgi:hypothetical protein